MDSNGTNAYFFIAVILIEIIVFHFVIRKLFQDFMNTILFLKRGEQTKGEIIDMKIEEDTDGRNTYLSVVKFMAGGDKEYITTTEVAKYIQPKIGAYVEVCYNKNNPNEAVVDGKSYLLYKAFIIVFISIVMISLALGCGYHFFSDK
jgi:hypothetical protein